MIERIRAREAELAELQATTAEVLAESMARSAEEQPPEPPDEAAMADAHAMEAYMQAMAEYSVRQQARRGGPGRSAPGCA